MADPKNAAVESEDVTKDGHSSGATQYLSRFMTWTDKLFDIENHKFLVGLNSGFVSAMITTLYRNPRLSLGTRLILPAICGITGAKSWQYLITKKIQSKELECSICANMRGLAIAVCSASILPATIGAIVFARRHVGAMTRLEKFTESFSETIIQRPVIVAAVLAQGSIGYIMASREFEINFLERLRK